MKKLGWPDWKNRMEELFKEQRSELELLRATVMEQNARLEKLESSSSLLPPKQPSNISEIREAIARVLRVPSSTKVPKRTPAASENKELANLSSFDSHQGKNATPEVLATPETTPFSRTAAMQTSYGDTQTQAPSVTTVTQPNYSGCCGFENPEVRVELGFPTNAPACTPGYEHENHPAQALGNSHKDKEASPEIIAISYAGKTELEVLEKEIPAAHISTATGNRNSKSAMKFKGHHRRKSVKTSGAITHGTNGRLNNSSADLDFGAKTKVHSADKQFKREMWLEICSKMSNLKDHLGMHTTENPFACEVCNKSFSHKGNLKVHMRIHTGVKPFTCDVCQKGFSKNFNLKRHTRMHRGEKPFTCDVCHKGFSENAYLKKHTRVHTGEKPFKCNICNASFRVSDTLAYHLRGHTGERPFRCNICSASFRDRNTLAFYVRGHTGERPYICEVCGLDFKLQKELGKHKKTHALVN